MKLTVEIPDKLDAALRARADSRGVSAASYVKDVLERELTCLPEEAQAGPPFKTGRGMLAKYGPAPSVEEIEENRAEMFGRFAEDF